MRSAIHGRNHLVIDGDDVVDGEAPVDSILQFACLDSLGNPAHFLRPDRTAKPHDPRNQNRRGRRIPEMGLLPVFELIEHLAMLVNSG